MFAARMARDRLGETSGMSGSRHCNNRKFLLRELLSQPRLRHNRILGMDCLYESVSQMRNGCVDGKSTRLGFALRAFSNFVVYTRPDLSNVKEYYAGHRICLAFSRA